MTDWDDRAKRLERRPLRTTLQWVLGGAVVLVVVSALLGLITTGSIFFQGEAAKLTNPAREKIVVFDPNRTISTYEGFYRLCNEFNANIVKAKDAAAEAKSREEAYDAATDPFGTDRKSIVAVSEDARALRNVARGLAAEYNADASANTRAPFRAADLPYTLDASGAEKATCGTSKEAGR